MSGHPGGKHLRTATVQNTFSSRVNPRAGVSMGIPTGNRYGMGIGNVINPMDLYGFCGDF